jgi:hypothetical protein
MHRRCASCWRRPDDPIGILAEALQESQRVAALRKAVAILADRIGAAIAAR